MEGAFPLLKNRKFKNMKKVIVLFCGLFVALAAAQTGGSKPQATGSPAQPRHSTSATAEKPRTGALPSQAEIDAAMQRSFGYDPAVSWNIYDIKESPLPGVADVLVSMNKQNPVHLYISSDGQNAIIGELIPFGPNPFAPARAKLKEAFGPARGPQSGTISIVEFSDLECPHCKAAQPILEKLVADFPQVRYVFQQFPLPATMHPWAMKAAEYSDCAGRKDSESFFKYIDAIFENQGAIALATADDKLKELATGAGLDAQQIANCAASSETEARVKKSMNLGQALDINQTPTVFINGRRVNGVGSIPYEQLKGLVQFEIEHAGK
jgi:protein-disulfide isomerase